MKGLLLKDFYMTSKYCRAFLLVITVFLAVSIYSSDNMFMLVYPCVLAGMIPISLMSYDKNSKWEEYAGGLPYTRSQMVSAKYLLGLISGGAALALTGLCQMARMSLNGGIQWDELLGLLAVLQIITCIVPSLTMPFLFKFGPEKGRIAYYVGIGLTCAFSASFVGLDLPVVFHFSTQSFLPLLSAAAVLLYAASWYLSILFYRKREL